jgi:hypothetical protein
MLSRLLPRDGHEPVERWPVGGRGVHDERNDNSTVAKDSGVTEAAGIVRLSSEVEVGASSQAKGCVGGRCPPPLLAILIAGQRKVGGELDSSFRFGRGPISFDPFTVDRAFHRVYGERGPLGLDGYGISAPWPPAEIGRRRGVGRGVRDPSSRKIFL